ncbi:sigma-70 family RNA polymerase sigma factor, partial [Myxococcota bacterium]|nr:sigma-70 family RNA polymerase sigma factor [Myxococcota bacterium]
VSSPSAPARPGAPAAKPGDAPRAAKPRGSSKLKKAPVPAPPPPVAEPELDDVGPQSGELELPPELAAVLPNEPPPEAANLSVPPPSKNMTRRELTEQYQPYVRSIAGKIKKTLSKDIEFDDLVGYGMLGLFEAADRYDAKFGANFMTFAYYRIRGAIYDGLRGMGWVSRTEYQRYRYENHANSYLASVADQQVASPPVKKSVDDEVNELADVVSGLVTIYVTALDAMEGFQIKDDRGPSVEESLEVLQARKLVAEAVSKLPEQEKTLLQLYYYKEMSLEDVGKQLGLSKSWTSRLHTRAIEKLSRLLRDLVSEYQDVNGTPPKLPPLGGGGPGPGGRTPLPQISTQPRGPTGR